MKVKIVTDGVPHLLLRIEDLPECAQEEFEYAFECGDTERQYHPRILQFEDEFCDIYEFQPVANNVFLEPLKPWQRYSCRHYRMGLVVREAPEKGCVLVGHWSAEE